MVKLVEPLGMIRLVTLALVGLLADSSEYPDPWYLSARHAPCLWGEEFTTDSPDGSHGYRTCGLRQLRSSLSGREGKAPCVVYSFGCDGEFSFERSIVAIHGAACEIHIFDPLIPGVSLEDAFDGFDAKVFFHQRSLLDKTGDQFLKPWLHMKPIPSEGSTLPDIMESLGHTHVDVLKIDIEGHEHRAITHLAEVGWPAIPGQVYLEVHKAPRFELYDERWVDRLIETLERADLQLVQAERPPRFCQSSCVQLSFIHKDWSPDPGPYPASGGWLKQEYHCFHDFGAVMYQVFGNGTDASGAAMGEQRYRLSRPSGPYPALRPGSTFNVMWSAQNRGSAALLKGCCTLERLRGWGTEWIRNIKFVGTDSQPLGTVEPGGSFVLCIEATVPEGVPTGFHTSRWRLHTLAGTGIGAEMEVAVRVL